MFSVNTDPPGLRLPAFSLNFTKSFPVAPFAEVLCPVLIPKNHDGFRRLHRFSDDNSPDPLRFWSELDILIVSIHKNRPAWSLVSFERVFNGTYGQSEYQAIETADVALPS
jgi:hypothetical protein